MADTPAELDVVVDVVLVEVPASVGRAKSPESLILSSARSEPWADDKPLSWPIETPAPSSELETMKPAWAWLLAAKKIATADAARQARTTANRLGIDSHSFARDILVTNIGAPVLPPAAYTVPIKISLSSKFPTFLPRLQGLL